MTTEQLDAWLRRYRTAWEERDPERAASLFTEDASYFETPGSVPGRGKAGVRAYWADATAGQREVRFDYQVVGVIGDQGIALWQAEYVRPATGKRTRLDGIFLLEFDASGACRTLREWWHRAEAQP